MDRVPFRSVKLGDFFKFKNVDGAIVYVRGEYDRSLKRFSCYRFDDVNYERFIPSDRLVFVGFEF